MMSCCHDIQFKFFISWRSVTKTRMFLTLIIKLVRSAICFTLSHPLLSSHLVKKSTLGNKGVGYKSILIVILLVTSLLNQTLFITSEPMILLVLVCSVINFCILMLGRVTNVACFWIHRGFLQLEIFFSLILYRLIVPQYWIFIDFTFGVVYSSWRCLIQKGKLIVESMCAWLWTHHSWRKFGFFKNDQENRKWFHTLHLGEHFHVKTEKFSWQIFEELNFEIFGLSHTIFAQKIEHMSPSILTNLVKHIKWPSGIYIYAFYSQNLHYCHLDIV